MHGGPETIISDELASRLQAELNLRDMRLTRLEEVDEEIDPRRDLGPFMDWVRDHYEEMVNTGYDTEFEKIAIYDHFLPKMKGH